MDVLLSLPILSYFFAGSMTSWSTSLNLLFFYMTWSALVLSYSPLRLELLGVFALRIVLWLVPSLLFLLFDTLLPSLAESIKHSGARALPPRNPKVLAKVLLLSITNLALETALEAGVSLGLTVLLEHPIFRTGTTLPLPWQIVKHVALLSLGREVLTYYIHRTILHAHPLSRGGSARASRSTSRVADMHASYAHARRAPPYSLALLADHPLPFLLYRFLPSYLPALAVRPHLLTYLAFVALTTIEETLASSGYSVVPGILMGGITRRAAVHCSRRGGPSSGNYGAWGVLDWAHGTSLGGRDVVDDMKDEAEKHQVKEKGEKAAGDAADAVQDGFRSWRKSRSNNGRRKKVENSQ
ncbi:Sterol desaturase family protein [Pleurostoma richardsiae]|uniref:Sterol desaturase family protein n=1 Tax=Pleurostoma richardsiae TaxID=41990 RepID=A0AA38RJA1_9PEZI|nr:Sterol desaturase family protein [Pleurostoma richardsiae]